MAYRAESYDEIKKCEFFDVIKQGTFYFEIKPCMKIEELSDTFMTRENLELMNVGNDRWEWNSRIYMGTEITETLKEWSEMIPDGCQSTSKDNTKIRIMKNELSHDTMRDYTPAGFTIRGDRIINKEVRQARYKEVALKEVERVSRLREAQAAAPYVRAPHITNNDMQHIRNAFDGILAREYEMDCTCRYYRAKTKSIFIFFKRLTSWDEIAKEHRKTAKKKEYLQDLKFMKKLWDDPTLEP